MINAINQNNSYHNIGFQAIPLARYGYLRHKSKDVVMYQLENSDSEYIRHLIKNLKSFFVKYNVENESAKQVIEEAFYASVELLKEKKHPKDKTRINGFL